MIILAIVELIIILLLIFLRKRLLIAVALIKEASRSVAPPRRLGRLNSSEETDFWKLLRCRDLEAGLFSLHHSSIKEHSALCWVFGFVFLEMARSRLVAQGFTARVTALGNYLNLCHKSVTTFAVRLQLRQRVHSPNTSYVRSKIHT